MKIMILTAKAGGGHLAMANSLDDYFALHFPDVNSHIVRLGEYAGKTFEYLVNHTYIWLVNNMSNPYGFFYNRLDRKIEKKHRVNKIRMDNGKSPRIRYLFQFGAIRRLKKIIEREKPDLVISCYHYCNILAYKTRHKYNLNYKIISVFADFLVNSVYYCHMVDAHVCSSEVDKERLIDVGVPENKIYKLGIPVNEKFNTVIPKQELYNYFHLPAKKTVLVLGGAFGGGRIKLIAKELVAAKLPYNFVFLCGSNKRLRKKLEKMSTIHYNLFPVGYTHEIEKYMDVADILISKVGGNGISEALCKKLPIIMVNPLPGQEQFNASYLEDLGMALYARNLKDILPCLKTILEEPKVVEGLRENIDKNFNPFAARDICRLAIKIFENQ